ERNSEPAPEETGASEAHEPEEILRARLPAVQQVAVAEQRGEEPLDQPASFVAVAKPPTVLRLNRSGRQVGCDHLDTALGQLGVERVAVVGAVPDQLLRKCTDETRFQGVDDELRFMSRTTRNPTGDRKAIAVCHCHDLGRFAASSDTNQRTPLFAPAWEPSMYASVRSSLPR